MYFAEARNLHERRPYWILIFMSFWF